MLGAGAITVGVLSPYIVEKIALAQSPLTSGSDSASLYKQLPVNITQRIFMFNITNEADFYNGAVPTFEELGPYTFM